MLIQLEREWFEQGMHPSVPERALFTGSREWDPRYGVTTTEQARELFDQLVELMLNLPRGSVIIHGAAPGLDTYAYEAGVIAGHEVLAFPAHWSHTEDCPPDCRRLVGKPAGPIRNKQMLDEGHPTRVFAFFRRRESTGTRNMVKQAIAARLPVREYIYHDQDSGQGDTGEDGGASEGAS